MKRLCDARGNTVEVGRLDGAVIYIPRDRYGYVRGAHLGYGSTHCTNPGDLAARGVDLATLKELV